MRVHVEVYHNTSRDASFGLNSVFDSAGKRPARDASEFHPLVKVFEYDTDMPMDQYGWLRVCEAAFETFNIGTDELAAAYRARGLRSLSVGDVLILGAGIDPVAYSCESCGWDARRPDELRVIQP